MGFDSAGYFFSDLLNFIFRINVSVILRSINLFTRVGRGDLFVQLLSCLDMLAWGLKLFTFQ